MLFIIIIVNDFIGFSIHTYQYYIYRKIKSVNKPIIQWQLIPLKLSQIKIRLVI